MQEKLRARLVAVSLSKVHESLLTSKRRTLKLSDMSSPTESVPAEVRRELMLALVAEHNFVRVSDLSEAFGISEVTVRADLEVLDRRRVIRRVRGGAVPVSQRMRDEPSFEDSLGASAMEKQLIGKAAASLVQSGESLILDVGSTTTFIARSLVARADLKDLVVLTNGVNIALELESAIPRFSVVVTGGTLRRLQHSLVDPMARYLLRETNADTVFIGCTGVDAERGVTNINAPEAEIKKQMLASASRRIVVADGSKIGQVELAWVTEIAGIDLLITGPTAEPAALGLLRKRGLEIMVVGG
ncbi:MAG TPA: DeoR/GlpR family DNA-binding transcription regulator [Streptosporangiaceae bacterium]|nr:DeoR/GlpR family DNA-binding transcription regulator [Streptosporangiaceae bacterium]